MIKVVISSSNSCIQGLLLVKFGYVYPRFCSVCFRFKKHFNNRWNEYTQFTFHSNHIQTASSLCLLYNSYLNLHSPPLTFTLRLWTSVQLSDQVDFFFSQPQPLYHTTTTHSLHRYQFQPIRKHSQHGYYN